MKNYLNKHLTRLIPLVLILLLVSFFRFYGLDWDQGQHLHPDERFLTMVATAIKIPDSFLTYLNPQISPMSPYNNNYSFFVYGTFPLYLTKIVGVLTNNNTYGNIHFVGRILSAIFDIGTVYLVYLISRRILSNHPNFPNFPNLSLIAPFLYSIMVLPIQLSHFFAVDTFLNFFLILSFYFLISLILSKTSNFPKYYCSIFLGIAFGLALACKISALYFLPIIGLSYLFLLFSPNHPNTSNAPKIPKNFVALTSFSLFFFLSLLSFRLAQPTAFSSGNFFNWQPNPQFVKNLNELKSMSGHDSWYPPSVQWHSAKSIIFPLKNMVLWGTGLPLGIISILSILSSLIFLISHTNYPARLASQREAGRQLLITFLIILWVLGLFLYQGIQFCKTMRYFLPIYPFLALLSGKFLSDLYNSLKEKLSKKLYAIRYTLYVALLVYPLSFINIYTQPITRVTASEWIYNNLPAGSVLLNEEWDDALPISLPGKDSRIYNVRQVFMYDPDSSEKWQRILPKINEADYVVLTSNRAYGSTMKLPLIYPDTIKYYEELFNSSGQFKKIAEFTSYPCFPPGNLNLFCFNDDGAEESFTVYDHPKVLIFKKKNGK